MRLLLGSLLVMLFSAPSLADQWVITPDGYYVLSLDSSGVPVLQKALGVTDHVVLGTPLPDPDDPGDPDDPPPTDDRWGLVAVSATEARKVNDAETAAKLALLYEKLGELVQDGTISQRLLKPALEIGYRSAVGRRSADWAAWRRATDEAYNDIDFDDDDVEQSGQGLIDIGIGARAGSSQEAIGDGSILEFIRFFIETILPLLLELFGNVSDSALEAAFE